MSRHRPPSSESRNEEPETPELEVFVTRDASRDIDEICDYIAEHDSERAATPVYESIKKAVLARPFFFGGAP